MNFKHILSIAGTINNHAKEILTEIGECLYSGDKNVYEVLRRWGFQVPNPDALPTPLIRKNYESSVAVLFSKIDRTVTIQSIQCPESEVHLSRAQVALVFQYAMNDQKVECIKKIREITNIGLKEAKDAVEIMIPIWR